MFQVIQIETQAAQQALAHLDGLAVAFGGIKLCAPTVIPLALELGVRQHQSDARWLRSHFDGQGRIRKIGSLPWFSASPSSALRDER
jgi:hypothetical protein